MLRAEYCRYDLQFKTPAITSRQVMTCKTTYFVRIFDEENRDISGIGECGMFQGLSCDDRDDYESVLAQCCRNVASIQEDISLLPCDFPSIRIGFETALYDYSNGGSGLVFKNNWSEGKCTITINGLVWMGSFDEMQRRVEEKIAKGFKCIKLKIGGIDFKKEIEIISSLRQSFSKDVIEIRLDANGAFSPEVALDRLDELSRFDIHSIEQPIRAGNWQTMKELCLRSPIKIALDEELIGLNRLDDKIRMVETIRPDYLILKPSLCGGFAGSDQWIEIAQQLGVGWWATSALESNIGLNAIAQWVATKNVSLPQGLGTGELYVNNVTSPLRLEGQNLFTDPGSSWVYPPMSWISV